MHQRTKRALGLSAGAVAVSLLLPAQAMALPIDAWSPPDVRMHSDLFSPHTAGSYYAYNGETIVDGGSVHSDFCGTGKTFPPSAPSNPGWNFGGPDPADAIYVSSAASLSGTWTSGRQASSS